MHLICMCIWCIICSAYCHNPSNNCLYREVKIVLTIKVYNNQHINALDISIVVTDDIKVVDWQFS